MLPKPEEVPKKPKSRGENLAKTWGGTKKTTKKNKVPEVLGPGGLQNFGFVGTSSGFDNIFLENFARTWGGTKKNQSLEVKILPKPEEVPKKQQKNQSSRSLGAWRPPELWFCWYLLRFWQYFPWKLCQNLRRYQKKPKSRGENLAKTWGGTKKKQQKNQSSRSLGAWRPPELWFFCTSAGFGNIFLENFARTWGSTKKNQSLEVKILPKPEEVPKKTQKNCGGLGLGGIKNFVFFLYFLRFWQGFPWKLCQNLRKYQKNQSLEVKILPKPEEVPKKTKKNKVPEVLGPGDLQNFGFFWYIRRFWRYFPWKLCQNLRRYQKNQSLEVKILPKPAEVPKKPKFWRSPGPKTSGTLFFLVLLVLPQVWAKTVLFFLVPPQVLARFYCQSLRKGKSI